MRRFRVVIGNQNDVASNFTLKTNDGLSDMNWPITILLANVVSTLFMVGLIWMVQIVHYPLFDDVGQELSLIHI